MRRYSAKLAFAFVLLWLPVSNGCRTGSNVGSPNKASAQDEAALRQATADWDRWFSSGQAANLAALYLQDLVSMPYDAPTVRGRQAEQEGFEQFFAENENARHETTVEEVLATGDWAIERGLYKMTYTPRKTGKQVVETGRHVMCRKKVNGTWLIAWELWNTDKPMASQ